MSHGHSTLIQTVLYLLVIGVICFLLDWLIRYVGVPEPFQKVARAIIAVFAVLLVISLLLSLVGQPAIIRW